MIIQWDRFTHSGFTSSALAAANWVNEGGGSWYGKLCDDGFSYGGFRSAIFTGSTSSTYPTPALLVNGLDVKEAGSQSIYGAVVDNSKNPWPSLSYQLQPGLAFYARLTLASPNYGINVGFRKATAGGSGVGATYCNLTLASDGTVTTGDSLAPASLAKSYYAPASASQYGTNVEVWLVCRRTVGGQPEVELWVALERTKNRPVCVWRTITSGSGQNVSWCIWPTGSPTTGACVIREVMFGNGTVGVPDPTIDPMQLPRDYGFLLANFNDGSLARPSAAPIGFATGGGYIYDSTRKIDFAGQQVAISDGPNDGTGILYTRNGLQWNATKDSSGNHLFDIDATHQRPALWIKGVAGANAGVFLSSGDYYFVVNQGGATLTFKQGSGARKIYAGRGVVLDAAAGTVTYNTADISNFMLSAANTSSNNYACGAWWTGTDIGQAVNLTVSSVSNGTITFALNGDTLPAAGTPICIGLYNDGYSDGNRPTDILYYLMRGPGGPFANPGGLGWKVLPLCEPGSSICLLTPTGTAISAIDPASMPNGFLINKTDRCVYMQVAKGTNGDIVALASRALTDDGTYGIYDITSRVLPAGTADITQWGAEGNVSSAGFTAVTVKGAVGTVGLGTYECFYVNGVARTNNGFPVYLNHSFGLYLYNYKGNWVISNVLTGSDSVLGNSTYWLGGSTITASTYAPQHNASGTLTATIQTSSVISQNGPVSGALGGVIPMPDGNYVVSYEYGNPDQSFLAVLDSTLRNSAAAPSNMTPNASNTPGSIIALGNGQEPSAVRLPDGSILVLARMYGGGVAYLAQATYANGQLTLTGTVLCDGKSNAPYLCSGSTIASLVVVGTKVYAFVTEPWASYNRTIMRVYECDYRYVMGGAGVGNQWVEASISPIWDSCNGAGIYGAYFQAVGQRLRGTASTFYFDLAVTDGVASGSGGGGGVTVGNPVFLDGPGLGSLASHTVTLGADGVLRQR